VDIFAQGIKEGFNLHWQLDAEMVGMTAYRDADARTLVKLSTNSISDRLFMTFKRSSRTI